MQVTVRFFASIRERLRLETSTYDVPGGATVADVWALLCRTHPALIDLGGSVSFAVNREYVDRAHRVAAGDEIAVIPPVSGGVR